jgi:RNA polymerase sigma-70 factor (ECF subfamily)
VVKTASGRSGVPIDSRSDEELMLALVEGDEAALGELYDRHAGPIFRAAVLRLGDRQLAEEVLQDTYLALWNRAELFDARAGSLRAWLSTIARNRSVDRLRVLGRRPPAMPLSGLLGEDAPDASAAEVALHAATPVSGVSASVDPEEVLDGAWVRAEVERALAGIPDQERQVIELAYYQELSQTEIAARLDWPLGTVKTRTRRALGRLRRSLATVLGPELGSRFAIEDEADGSR